MLIFVISKLGEAKIPEIWENEEETGLSVDELKRFYKEFARKNFRQHPYVNKNTGWKVRVSAQGIGEIKKFRKREHIILARCLGTMLEDSILYCTVPDNKNTPGIECVSYLDYRCNVNGKKYLVRLTVKKAYSDDAHFFYYYKLLPCA